MFLSIFVNDRFKIDSGGSLGQLLNSLCVWPYDATWQYRFLSSLVLINYLNQCWPIYNVTLKNTSEWMDFNEYILLLEYVSQPTELSMVFCSWTYFLLTDTVSCSTVDGTGMFWSKHWFSGLTRETQWYVYITELYHHWFTQWIVICLLQSLYVN